MTKTLSPREQMIADLRNASRGPTHDGGDEFRQDNTAPPPASARDARAGMIRGLRGTPASRQDSRKVMISEFREDTKPAGSAHDARRAMIASYRQDSAPSGAAEARAAMIAGLGSKSDGARADGLMNAGPYPSSPVASSVDDGRQVVRSPNDVVAYWEGLRPGETKRREETRTAAAMRQLLLRKGRREFPFVPVLFDGRRLPGIVLDAGWTFLRLAIAGSGRAGPGSDFDPLDFLLTNLPRAEAALKRSGAVPADWPANLWQWEQNTAEDLRADQQALSIDFRTLAAPLVLTSLRAPLTEPEFPEELRRPGPLATRRLPASAG